MSTVGYIVDDASDAIAFSVSKLGSELEQQYGSAIATLVRGDLTLWVAGPRESAPSRCRMTPHRLREAGPGSC